MIFTVAVWLVIAVVYGFCWGWDYGKRAGFKAGEQAGRAAGDRAHVACHEAQQAIYDQARRVFLQAVSEHADIEAWEEEL